MTWLPKKNTIGLQYIWVDEVWSNLPALPQLSGKLPEQLDAGTFNQIGSYICARSTYYIYIGTAQYYITSNQTDTTAYLCITITVDVYITT